MPIKKQASYEYFEIYVSDLCWEHMAHYIKTCGYNLCKHQAENSYMCIWYSLGFMKKVGVFFTNGQSSDVYEDPWY